MPRPHLKSTRVIGRRGEGLPGQFSALDTYTDSGQPEVMAEAGGANTNATRSNAAAELGSPEAQPLRKKVKEAPDWHTHTQPFADGDKDHPTTRVCLGCNTKIHRGCARVASMLLRVDACVGFWVDTPSPRSPTSQARAVP